MGGKYVPPVYPKKKNKTTSQMANVVRRYLIKRNLLKQGPCQSFVEIAEVCIRHLDTSFSLPISKKDAKNIICAYYSKVYHGDSIESKKSKAPIKKYKSAFKERASFYDTDAWRSLRYEALKAYGRKCMVCGSTPETGAQLHVDHIKPRSLYPHLELVLGNLQILCRDCNLGKSNKDSIDWRQAAEKES